ncbi:MAG: hypothetical protein KDA84_28780 [Planctomycetaceae bacterium]|nr:hypothetical protein [Planctomycetaceae bacterium]
MTAKIPLVILAGSDSRRGPLHEKLSADQVITGFKGALPLASGKCLAAELIDRYRQTGRFEDPVLLGPRAVYRDLVDCEIADVEGSLAATLQCLHAQAQQRWSNGQAIAVSACDILPTSNEIVELLETGYDPNPECQFWWQMIQSEPNALGASSWKPKYLIRKSPDQTPEPMYPGHLVIFRPEAIRMSLWIRIMALTYRYRNLPIRKRVLPMLVRGLGMLAAQDLRNLTRGQLPILTFSIPWHFLRAFKQHQKGTLSIPLFEEHISRVLLHRECRTANAVIVTLTKLRSFAQDIDSKQEYESVKRLVSSAS